jgi:glc operon protein GlcG
MRRMLNLIAALLMLSSADAAPEAQAAGAPPATYASGADLAAEVKKGAATTPNMATGRVANTDQYRINVVHRGAAAGAIVHADGTEVHHITDGAGTLVTGGTIVRAEGRGAATIQGGVSKRVQKGDVILIPAGTPHWYKEVEGTITYLEVRFNVPK